VLVSAARRKILHSEFLTRTGFRKAEQSLASRAEVDSLIRDLRSLPAVAGNPRPATPEALAKAGFQKISAFSA